ncbi:P-loop containing nucleoside triphosphate hydrolase protein [Trichoderma afarasin]
MAGGYNDATGERAYIYPMRETGRSQPSSATLTGSTLGDYGNIHQGDHIINIDQLRSITNNYAYLPPLIGSHPTFDSHQDQPRTLCWTVPFGRNKDFVGRELILYQLLKMIPPNADEDDCQQTVISGLGGIGKTQIALEAAFRVRARCPDCHVFWVPAINTTTFENAYREIGRELNIQIVENDKADIKLLVKAALSQISDSWLLIIDNADDATLFGETSEVTSLRGYLPFNLKGSILFTTRNVEVSQKLDIRKDNIIHLTGMSQAEATNMLQKGLDPHQMSDAQSLESLLEFLANLPLAIKQASAYMIKTEIAISQYLEYCRSSDEALIRLLSKNFDDRTRYETIQNPIATTWMISFEAISRDNPLAAKYLRFMSFLAEKDIPKDLLPPASDQSDTYEAISTLKAYGFISEQESGDAYDMHRLVRLVMQNWMRENKGELQTHITKVMQRFDAEVPVPLFSNKDKWVKYLPHMTMALKFQDYMSDQILKSSILLKALYGLFILGKYSDAKEMNQRALDLHIKVLGDEHPSTLEIMDMSLAIAACDHQSAEIEQIKTMSTLSLALTGQGYDEEAEQISRQALDSLIETQAFGHPVTLACMSALSLALFSQSRYEECVQIGQQQRFPVNDSS